MSEIFCCIVGDVQQFAGLGCHHQETIKGLKQNKNKKSNKKDHKLLRESFLLQRSNTRLLLLLKVGWSADDFLHVG
jgi:hypothetical protein